MRDPKPHSLAGSPRIRGALGVRMCGTGLTGFFEVPGKAARQRPVVPPILPRASPGTCASLTCSQGQWPLEGPSFRPASWERKGVRGPPSLHPFISSEPRRLILTSPGKLLHILQSLNTFSGKTFWPRPQTKFSLAGPTLLDLLSWGRRGVVFGRPRAASGGASPGSLQDVHYGC